MGVAYVRNPTELDGNLERIDSHLQLLEQEVVHEYRHLLAGARMGVDQVLRFPAQSRARFHQTLPALQAELESSGYRTELRLVSELHEALRLRMLVLEHLLERDVPFAYLKRAFRPILDRVLLIDKGASEQRTAATRKSSPAPMGCCHRLRHGFTALFRHEQPSASQRRATPRHSPSSGAGEAAGQRFNELPDHLKHLFLLYHFLERDELRLLKASQRLPSLGSGFVLQGSVAVFEAEERGERHWHARAEKPATNVRELQEKLNRQGHRTGVKSHFPQDDRAEQGRGMTGLAGSMGKLHPDAAKARSPEELHRKLHSFAQPTDVRAEFPPN